LGAGMKMRWAKEMRKGPEGPEGQNGMVGNCKWRDILDPMCVWLGV
jgi:hypothetical protein